MTLKSILTEWQNVIFAVSFAIGLIYALLYAFLGIGEEFGADLDHDVDHDLDHDADHDLTLSGGLMSNMLSFLGVGRCPLSIIMIILTMSWGFIGLTSNAFFINLRMVPGSMYFWVSLFIATVLGLLVTRYVSVIVAKIIPRMETSAVKEASLVGKIGEARTIINSVEGSCMVRDEHGTIHNVYCHTETDDIIKPNEGVILLKYLDDVGRFIVSRKPKLPMSQ